MPGSPAPKGPPLSGGCLCGSVRYRVVEDPIAFYVCHCTDCQRQTGSAFGLSMVFRAEAVERLADEPRSYAVTLPDGRTKHGVYCGRCGVRLWGQPEKFPQIRVLRPGTLDDPYAYRPYGDIWTDSAQPWSPRTPGPQHPRQPEDPLALVRAWQGRPGA